MYLDYICILWGTPKKCGTCWKLPMKVACCPPRQSLSLARLIPRSFHSAPAQAERRALTWPALTACDTITGWGIRFRPRFRRQKRGQINVTPFFIYSAGTPSCLGLNLQICDILSTERIQCILKHYKLDHMKQLFKVFIEIIVIFWESSTGFFLN
jgi:hypothetical protein